MMKKRVLLVIFILSLFIVAGLDGLVQATSLWVDGGWGESLLKDRRAKDVGDLLTIIVVEDSKASQQTGVDGKQENSINAGPGLGIFSFVPALKIETGQGDAASGTISRQGSLSTKITATIVEVMGNGNFTIEGVRTFKLNGEEQKIVLRGIIRPDDIMKDNTILSTYISDAQIEYTGSGHLGDKQNPGILTRIFNFLF
jgi:flagellar L-ring protein precursor FlgH